MDRNKLNILLAAVITTVDELGEAPEGILYAGLMSQGYTLDQFNIGISLMQRAGLATSESYLLKLTPAGHEMAAKINAAHGTA